MDNINEHPISLYRGYKSSDSPPLVRAEKSSSSNSHHPVKNHSILVIINVSHNSELERFSSGSLDRETLFNESSFDTILSDEDVGRDHVVKYVSSLSVVA